MDYDPTRKSLYKPESADPLPDFAGDWTRDAICCELSRLAYYRVEEKGGDPRLNAALVRAGFSAAVPFGDAGADAQAFGTVGPDGSRYVAFRGTQAGKWRDLLSDLNAKLEPFAGETKVHLGFLKAYRSLERQIGDWLAENAAGPLIATGHSLGAAMATVMAAAHPEATLVTFGSPRVGNAAFAAGFAGRTVRRYVDCADFVTTVPPELIGYIHIGEPLYIDQKGGLHEAPPADAIAEDRRAARALYVLHYAPKFWRNVLVRDLADHAPINYVSALLGRRTEG